MKVVNRFFEQGFRPFFLAAGLWAVLSMFLWLLIIEGRIAPDMVFSPMDWHIHEMIYGYVGAVIAGFLLTAVPNWTGVPSPKGAALAGLFGLWIAGRLVVFFAPSLPFVLVMAIDLSFLILFEIYLVKALLKSDNKRNLVVAGLISLLILANALMHLDVGQALGRNLALATVIMLISLIGGRVIPNFTRGWLARNNSPVRSAEFGLPDKLALLSSVIALACFVAGLEGLVPALAFFVASLLGFFRLIRWHGLSTAKEPLIWILHVAYLWLPVGYHLMAISYLIADTGSASALHALTTGAIGTMTLAVMTRATLGHTGRALVSNPATTLVFLLVSAAAIFRVSAGLIFDAPLSYSIAGSLWIIAYLIFIAAYGPMFFKSRAD